MARKQHPNKEIEAAICFAEAEGWRYKKAGSSAHAWGRIICALNSRDGCAMSIWSTPKSTHNHAKQIMRRVKRCSHNA